MTVSPDNPNLPPMTELAQSLPSTVPFVGPETLEREMGRPYLARIGANENVFGPSPKALAAMQAEAAQVWKYGDPENHDLKQALSAHLDAGAANIAIGEGIDGLLGEIVRLFITPGEPIISSLGGYPTFHYHVQGYGGKLCTVPYRDDREDLTGLLDLARKEKGRIIYVANPDNPMGTWWPAADIEQMVSDLPPSTLLILDEAYLEFVPKEQWPHIDPNHPQVLRMRTFSKAYAMAGARVAYAIGAPQTIIGFDKIRNHFGINRIGQVGALAALADQDYLAQTIANVNVAKARITQIAEENGLTALPSFTNFVSVDCGRDEVFAKAVLDGLLAREIFVRMPWVAPQNRCIRISAGTPEQLDLLANAMPDALKEKR